MDAIEKQMFDIVTRHHKAFANRDIDALTVRLNAISARRKPNKSIFNRRKTK